MKERLAAALEFAELGCRVGPVKGKNPGGFLGDDWQNQFSRDRRVLRGWFDRLPDANVGVLGARAVVPIDVDDPAGLERLERKAGRTPVTPRFFTGGAHPPGRERLLFAHPSDDSLERFGSDRKLIDGVQLRDQRHGSALMSLVPPSRHPDTGVLQDWRIALDEAPLAPLPRAWLELLEPRRTANGTPIGRGADHWCRVVTTDVHEKAGSGAAMGRHDEMVPLAGYLMRRLESPQTVLELLLGWNARHCKPPKDEGEVIEIVTWVARKEYR